MEITVKHVISVSPETQEFFTALVTSIFSAKPAAPVAEVPKTRKKADEKPVVAEPAKEETPAPPVVLETPATPVEEDDMLGDAPEAEISGEELFKMCQPHLQNDKNAPIIRQMFNDWKEKHNTGKVTVTKLPDGTRNGFRDLVLTLPKI